MSWVYLPESAEEFLEESCADLKQSATSKTIHTAKKFSGKELKMEFLPMLQSGMTLKHLTGNRGVDLWILSQRDSLASHSLSLAREWGKTMQKISGRKPFASLRKFPRNGFFWKTYRHCSLKIILEKFLVPWPKSGILVNGNVYQHNSVEQNIKEIGYGLSVKKPFIFKPSEKKWFPTPIHSDTGKLRCCKKQYFSGTLFGALKNRLSSIIFLRKKITRQKVKCEKMILNPAWIEWLMGFPIGLTSLAPLKTKDFLNWKKKVLTKKIWEKTNISQIKTEEIFDRQRNQAIGNAQVPTCVYYVWKNLVEGNKLWK